MLDRKRDRGKFIVDHTDRVLVRMERMAPDSSHVRVSQSGEEGRR